MMAFNSGFNVSSNLKKNHFAVIKRLPMLLVCIDSIGIYLARMNRHGCTFFFHWVPKLFGSFWIPSHHEITLAALVLILSLSKAC